MGNVASVLKLLGFFKVRYRRRKTAAVTSLVEVLPTLPVIQRMEPSVVREGILPCRASRIAPIVVELAECKPTLSFSRTTLCSSRSRLMGFSK